MNEQQFKLWIAELPKLTVEQHNDLKIRLSLLAAMPKDTAGKSDFGIRVLQAIVDVMKKNNVESTSVNVLKKSSAYVAAKPKIENLQIFFESITLSKIVQDQILRMGIDLLYFDLLNWQGFSISSHTILSQIYRVPATLNRAFPGYAGAGLLTKLVKGA